MFHGKKNRHRSYRAKCTRGNIAVLDRHVKLPKLGHVRCAVSKQVRGRILSATVSQTPSGKYFVSVCCTDVDIMPFERTEVPVGLDLGLKALVVTSEGTSHPNHKYLPQSEKKLARAQRRLSRKTIGSKNQEKARIKVARIQERIANQRSDTLHNLTTELVQNYDVICVEDLAVGNMVRNHRLARAISDASWGEFVRQLGYKCAWYGKTLVRIDRFYPSSQICSACGFKNPAVKNLAVREWQ